MGLDGRLLRTIAAGQFRKPHALTASHGKAFVVDADGGGDVRITAHSGVVRTTGMLHVIDIQSGDLLQSVRFDWEGEASAVLVDGDEIYITGFYANRVVVLQLYFSSRG